MTVKDKDMKPGTTEVPIQFGDEPVEHVEAETESELPETEEESDVQSDTEGKVSEQSEREPDSTPEDAPRGDAEPEGRDDGAGGDAEPLIESYELRIDELVNRIDELEKELKAEREAKLRYAAEAENTRRRAQKDIEHARFAIKNQLLQDFLLVLDHLEMALSHSESSDGQEASDALIEGVKMVISQFLKVLEKHGVEVIDALGQHFDPAIHEAMAQQPSEDAEPGTVINQYRKGYRIGDKLIRPAQVIVASAPYGNSQNGQ